MEDSTGQYNKRENAIISAKNKLTVKKRGIIL